MQHSKRNDSWIRWVIFLGVAAALGALVWLGWSVVVRHRALPGIAGNAPESTATIGIGDMPDSLDLRTAASPAAERLLLDNVYETLVTVDQHNQLKPGLATAWKVSDDGLTYTLTIASGDTFSNGHTLDAADVVWSLQQSVTGKVAGVDELGNLTSITNPNASTVVIALAQPNPTLLRALSGRLGIVYDADAGNTDYARQAVGSGPFTVGAFDPGKSLTLNYSTTYYGTKAKVGTVTFTQYADDTALAQALTDGKVDMAAPASAAVAAAAKGKDGLTVKAGASTGKVLLAFNNGNDSIMSDEQARKAMRYSIDAAGIAASQPDSAGALGGPVGPLEEGYEDLTGLYPYDLAKAQSLYAYFGSEYLTTVNLVVPERYRALGETIAQQIGQLARPTVVFEVLSDEDYAKRIEAGKWELTVMSMDGDGDAGEFADPDSIFHYDHAEAQQAWAAVRAARNETEYAEKMKAYARLISEDAASDWLYARKCFTVASAKVSGYPTGLIDQRLPLAGLVMQHA